MQNRNHEKHDLYRPERKKAKRKIKRAKGKYYKERKANMSLEEAYRIMRINNNNNKVQNIVKFEKGEISTDKEKIPNKIAEYYRTAVLNLLRLVTHF